MKWVFELALIGSAAIAQVTISAKALVPETTELDKKTYAAVDFPVAEFAPLLKNAEQIAGQKLVTRGEAHMTVMTPPEYMRLDGKLRKQILSEIKRAVAQEKLKPVCIGRGQAEVKGAIESTYFLVVEAKEVKAVREKYHLTDFYPHVTLGFTKRDLHFEDGVKKDKSSCVAEISAAAD